MLETFTDRSRKCIAVAKKEAARAKCNVYPCHLLASLFYDQSGVAATVLKNLEFDIGKLYSAATKCFNRGSAGSDPNFEVSMSLPALSVLRIAREEANKLSHKHVGTEHLLLALLIFDDIDIKRAFEDCLISYQVVRQGILEILGIAIPEDQRMGACRILDAVQTMLSYLPSYQHTDAEIDAVHGALSKLRKHYSDE